MSTFAVALTPPSHVRGNKASIASSPKSPPPASVVKMQKHCQVLARDAEKLAADATKAAEYHSLRAKELQGR